jgi:hypothetical protein
MMLVFFLASERRGIIPESQVVEEGIPSVNPHPDTADTVSTGRQKNTLGSTETSWIGVVAIGVACGKEEISQLLGYVFSTHNQRTNMLYFVPNAGKNLAPKQITPSVAERYVLRKHSVFQLNLVKECKQ